MTVYVSDLFTATPAPVNASPTSTRTWQWLRGSSAISGATSATYTAVTADIGSTLAASQLETNFLATATATSAPTEVVQAFDPIRLFSASEPGVWYDPSDMSTLFQNAAGTIPVTSFGQPVGLMLDKSRGLVLGPELVVNGDFATDTWWLKGAGCTISGGVGVAAAAVTGSGFYRTAFLTIGSYYEITFTVASVSAGGFRVGFFASAYSATRTAPGTYTVRLRADGTSFVVETVGTTTGSIDNISIRELPGLHATQSTEASRPLYGIVPVSGRRNLLTQTEAFNVIPAPWGVGDVSVTANTTTAPDGTTTADKLVEFATTGLHFISQTATIAAGANTFSVYLKAAERQFAFLYHGLTNTGFSVNLATGATGLPASSVAPVASSVTLVGDGWYRVSMTVTATAGAQFFRVYLSDTLTGGGSYTGNGTSGLFAWGAQLETGSTPTAYQRVSTDLDVTEAGVASVGYLRFDGSTSWMATPTITPGTDKVQVFAGVYRIADSTDVIAEFSTNWNTSNGSFLLWGGTSMTTGTGPGFNSGSRGDAAASASQAGISPTTFTPPVTAVVTALHDISGDLSSVRGNGVAGVNSTVDKGAGNFLAYPLYIGRRNGTDFPLQGHLFPLIVRFGPNLTAARIAATEAWVATKTGGVTL